MFSKYHNHLSDAAYVLHIIVGETTNVLGVYTL